MSRFTYAFTAFWYVVPPNCGWTGDTPSQHCSLSGIRTVRTFHERIAVTDAWSIGPSQIPLPWIQANSPPERFTPSSRYAAPDAVSSLLPDTCSAGAAPVGGGDVGGGDVGGGDVGGGDVGGGDVVLDGETVGDVDTVEPVQATPFSEKLAGLPLVPVHEPLKPIDVDAPVPRLPFHDMLVAVTLAADCDQFADQPWVTCWPFGNAKRSVQADSASPRFLTVTLAVKPPEPVPQSFVV